MAVSLKQQQQILKMIAEGSSLRSACKRAEVLSVSDWYDSIDSDDDARERYTRARLKGYEARADKLHDDCWDMSIDPAHKRIITDTQKWELAKMLPKIYGDKLQVETKASQADALTDEELAAIIARK